MTPRCDRRPATFAMVLSMLTASTLTAANAMGADRVHYRHVAGRCPETYEAAFILAARAPGLVVVDANEPADADLAVEPVAGGYQGELAIAEFTRTVTSRHCRDVIDALGLVYALARASAPPAVEAPELASPELPSAAPDAAPRVLDGPPRPVVVKERGDASLHGALGVRGGVLSGVGPSMAPRGELFVELSLTRPRPWRPAVRGGVAYAVTETRALVDGAASFALWAATLETHVASLGGRDGRMSVSPFVRAQLGNLAAESTGLADARREHALWATVGAGASASWVVANAVSLEASAGLDVALARPRFYFEPGTTVHRVAGLGAFVTIGLVLPIW